MGLRPAQCEENQVRRHPRESGGPLLVRTRMDSHFRGNDVIFERAAGDGKSGTALEYTQSEIPRFARNDSVDAFSHRI